MDADWGALLVVDDNEMNRDMLSRRLTRRGYTVSVADSGQQALDMIAAQCFDLVLLDIMMPGLDGLEVLKLIREQYAMSELPIIMATAKHQSDDIVVALQRGANDYVTKPLDFPVVLARVQTQLSLKRAMEKIQRMAEQLELRNRFIRETFGRYLTDEVVTSLLDSPEGLRLGGEKRQVTMLMADLRGFTSLASRLEPEQVVTIINRYLGVMVEVITSYHGTIDEFIGDAIFVIFGAPLQRPDDTERAVACAVAMQLAMATVNEQNKREGLPEVEMGIGVHTGEVVVGNIGSQRRSKYGVVGSHVNLTSRIESYTVGGQILISEATRGEVASRLEITGQMEIDAKGIRQPVTIHEIRGIDGTYNLFLPEKDDTLFCLAETISLQYAPLEGKHLGEGAFKGQAARLSFRGVEVCSDIPITLWTNLKIQPLDKQGNVVPGDLYAKVLRYLQVDRPGFYAHFTFVSPEIAAFICEILSKCSSGNIP